MEEILRLPYLTISLNFVKLIFLNQQKVIKYSRNFKTFNEREFLELIGMI